MSLRERKKPVGAGAERERDREERGWREGPTPTKTQDTQDRHASASNPRRKNPERATTRRKGDTASTKEHEIDPADEGFAMMQFDRLCSSGDAMEMEYSTAQHST